MIASSMIRLRSIVLSGERWAKVSKLESIRSFKIRIRLRGASAAGQIRDPVVSNRIQRDQVRSGGTR